MEPLAEAIRCNEKISGIKTKQDQHEIVLYADDVLLFLTNPSTSLPELIQVVNRFSSFSGYKINFGESVALPMGRLQQGQLNFPFPINRNGLKYLGIFIPYDLNQLTKHNIVPVIAKIKNDLERCSVYWQDCID